MKRKMVVEVMAEHHLSQRRACGLIGITRRALHRVPAEDRNRELRQRLGRWLKSGAGGAVRCCIG